MEESIRDKAKEREQWRESRKSRKQKERRKEDWKDANKKEVKLILKRLKACEEGRKLATEKGLLLKGSKER